MSKMYCGLASLLVLQYANPVFAQSGNAICAIQQIIACPAFEPCERGLPDAVNLPALIKVDLDAGVLLSHTKTGGDRTSPIALTELFDEGYAVSGVDTDVSWSLRVAEATGRFTFASAHEGEGYIGFGICAVSE